MFTVTKGSSEFGDILRKLAHGGLHRDDARCMRSSSLTTDGGSFVHAGGGSGAPGIGRALILQSERAFQQVGRGYDAAVLEAAAGKLQVQRQPFF